jgi:uncharacterized protein with PQ loop repeat
MSWLSLFGWGLAIASTVTVVPQAVRLYRTGDKTGISLPTVALATGTMALWCVYTFAESDWPAFGSSLGPLLAWGAILLRLARAGVTRQLLWSSAAALAFVTIGTAAGVAHLAAASGSLLWALPQAIESVRTKDLQGVSALSYAAIAAENGGWVVYAAGTGRWAYAVAPLAQAPLAVLIAWRAARSHRRDDR